VADVAQIPVIVSGETDATASGTALLARIAEGTATYADASDTPGENSLVTPRWSLDRATDFRQRWSCAIRTEELT